MAKGHDLQQNMRLSQPIFPRNFVGREVVEEFS